MMLKESECYKRNCIHYQGVKQPDNEEINEFHYCKAYPDGIPLEIVEGEDLHEEVRDDQENKITFRTKD